MVLLTPDLGFIFWHTIIFLFSLLILSRFAWKPILQAIKTREKTYEKAIIEMQKAEKELQQLATKKAQIIENAHQKSDLILQQALENKQTLLKIAEEEALKEKQAIINQGLKTVELAKNQAWATIKNKSVDLVAETTEKLIYQQLLQDHTRQQLIENMIKDVETQKKQT